MKKTKKFGPDDDFDDELDDFEDDLEEDEEEDKKRFPNMISGDAISKLQEVSGASSLSFYRKKDLTFTEFTFPKEGRTVRGRGRTLNESIAMGLDTVQAFYNCKLISPASINTEDIHELADEYWMKSNARSL